MVCCTFAQHHLLTKHSEFNRHLQYKVEPLPLDVVKQFFSKSNASHVTLRGEHETITDEPWQKFASFFDSEPTRLPYSPQILQQLSELIQQEPSTRVSKPQIAAMLRNPKKCNLKLLHSFFFRATIRNLRIHIFGAEPRSLGCISDKKPEFWIRTHLKFLKIFVSWSAPPNPCFLIDFELVTNFVITFTILAAKMKALHQTDENIVKKGFKTR